MQNYSMKYLQVEFNNTLKRSDIMIKLTSFQECKDGSAIKVMQHTQKQGQG
jgi:hypothetical protein